MCEIVSSEQRLIKITICKEQTFRRFSSNHLYFISWRRNLSLHGLN